MPYVRATDPGRKPGDPERSLAVPPLRNAERGTGGEDVTKTERWLNLLAFLLDHHYMGGSPDRSDVSHRREGRRVADGGPSFKGIVRSCVCRTDDAVGVAVAPRTVGRQLNRCPLTSSAAGVRQDDGPSP